MKKKPQKVAPKAEPKKRIAQREIRNEAEHMIKNGLAEAVLGFDPQSIGVQLSQVDTLFKNNRWYLISNMRQLLSEIYVEHGLIQTVVDVPVDDGFRGGIDVKTKQLSPEQLQNLVTAMERDNDLGTIGQSLKWNRLFGGAGTLILTDQDPATPLDIEAITEETPLSLRAVDMWELFWDQQNIEGFDMELQQDEFECYSYYGEKVHKTRVLKLKGITAPSFIRPRLRGWGFSIVESLVRSINQYLKATDLTFEVLDEFKVDAYKIKNLTNTLLQPNGTAMVQKRIQLANQQKNYNHAIIMDSEDDYVAKELSFTGIAETMQGIRMQVASDLRMPLTKVFGISASGFSSGEDDIENYNSMVESQVREKSKFHILSVVELRCQKMFGFIPEDLSIDFKPLRILSSEQEENVKTQKFTRAIQAKQAGEITTEEFRNICNKENLLEIQLEMDISGLDLGVAEEGENNEPDKASAKAPAAKKSVTQAPKAKT